MANRNWRSNNYQTFNQILTPMSYYSQPVSYPAERKNYGGRGGYREDNYKRERKDLQSNRRERFSPNKRRSPYQRSHETHGNFRKDSKKSHGHYEVKVPRLTFDIQELSTSSIKFRYPKMYIPSDFFHTHLNLQEVFPLYRPMKLGNHCEFQVLNKEVEMDVIEDCATEPEDANYKYSAKVMLMTTPELPELYKLSCHLPSEHGKYGVYKNIQFLVGNRGKNEPVAIGGPWSPSLDGADPENDPSVLVRTAIRTCLAQTSIDLTNCKKWYKFLDIHYYRPSERKMQTEEDTDKKEANECEEKPTVEVVTIFIPDVWSCIPSEEEWADVREQFDNKLHKLLNPNPVEETTEESKEEVHEKMEEVKEKVEEIVEEVKVDVEVVATVDLNQLKVTELRAELANRGLDIKGLKMQLIQRLQEAMDNEKSETKEVATAGPKVTKNESGEATEPTVETVTPVASCQVSEKEHKRLEKLYKLNDKPSIMVRGAKNAKGVRMEFSLMTLESLLEYRTDDQKEHVFEVSLFAEQFCEMLQRDAAFVIYKALIDLPEQTKEAEPEAKKPRLDAEPRKSRMIADIHLLFAFFVFDCDNSGYLRDHDLESILHSIGLNLSRSQVKKLLAKMPLRKGTCVYRDVVEREVIEGSVEDLAMLKTSEPNIDRLIELSHGNKAFFDEVDTETLASRDGSLLLLDKINNVSTKKVNHQLQLSLLEDELNKLKTSQSNAGDVEKHLRDNIKKIQDKLTIEKDALTKLRDVSQVYNALLTDARHHMDVSVKAINDQFDHEKQEKEEAERLKAEVERLKAEAERLKAEAERLKAEAEKAKVEEAAKMEANELILIEDVDCNAQETTN